MRLTAPSRLYTLKKKEAMIRRIGRAIRNNILVGLAMITPVGVTILIANWLFRLVTGLFIPEQLNADPIHELALRAAALVAVVIILFLFGFFIRSFLGKKLYRVGEKILERIPVFNKLYVQIRHISEVLIGQRESILKEVVLVEYPRQGLYSVGFVTADVPAPFERSMAQRNDQTGWVSLFIPTTPNPTSGLMIMSPRSELIPLSLHVAEAMKLIVSSGAVHPGDPMNDRPTLLDKLEGIIARDGKAETDEAREGKNDGPG